jgi:hypothetical protein
MKRRTTTLAFLFTAALAACQGVSTFAPPAGSMDDASTGQSIRAPLPAPYDTILSSFPDASEACNAPNVKIPGKYISMVASGGTKGSTFTSSGALNLWLLEKATKGTKPTPTPSSKPTGNPSTGPTATPKPKPIDVYFYTGTYRTRRSKETGCAILIVSVSGKAISKGEGSGIGVNTVQYAAKYVNVDALTFGPLQETVSNLSASGGRGSVTMKTAKGKLYDTASITLTKRVEIKYP